MAGSYFEPVSQAHNRSASFSQQRPLWPQSVLHELAGGIEGPTSMDSAEDMLVAHPKSVTEQVSRLVSMCRKSEQLLLAMALHAKLPCPYPSYSWRYCLMQSCSMTGRQARCRKADAVAGAQSPRAASLAADSSDRQDGTGGAHLAGVTLDRPAWPSGASHLSRVRLK